MVSMSIDTLDPRWEWIEVTCADSLRPEFVRGRCLHTDVVPVDSVVTGEAIAQLCQTCDTQLPAGWQPE